MARLEIPSIVVHNGSNSAPGSPVMERSLRIQRTLSKQAEFEEHDKDESAPSNPPSCQCQVDDAPRPAMSKDEPQKPSLPKQDSVDVEDKAPLSPRVRSQSKVKVLIRSHAMREETSPPPDLEPHSNSLSVSRGGGHSRHKLRHQGSSQGSMESSSPCLSRDSSTEQYTDSTGVDLHQFISDTLNRNSKDRNLLLKIEQELVNLAKDNQHTHHKFPPMSSYQRMLVHRVAAFFGMDHNVDQTGFAVIVNVSKSTRLPDVHFRDLIRDEVLLYPEEPRRSILKRDSSSFEENGNFKSPEHQYSSESRRSKSFEEREEEYEKARKRIFNRENGSCDPLFLRSQESSQEELRWSGDVQPWSSSDSEPPSNRLSLPHNLVRPSRLFKVESFEGRDTLKANSMRQAVAKSYSFGGYPVSVLSRGDSCSSTHSAGARLLTKQDSSSSMSSRLSPSSSGYKSQSQRSDATMSATPSPTATPVSLSQVSSHSPDRTVMWAVTNISSVPPGSLLINPETGQPYVNLDGSAYRYDPANPPRVIVEEESLSSGENPSSPAEPEPSTPDTQISQETQPPAKVNCATSPGLSPVRKVAVAQVTTTATSPSLPVTPPPITPVNTNIIHQPCSTTLDSNLPPPPPPIYNTTSSTNLMYAAPQQFLPAAPQSEVVYGQQPVIYAGYNMVAGPPHFDNRHSSDSSSMSMSDLSGYLMGMNLVSDQHRGGGDTNNPPMQPPHSYQPPFWHHSTPTAGSQQPPGSVPMYLVPPPPPLVNTSPPQQVNGNNGSAPSTPRYLPGPPPTYATYQPVPTTNQDRAQHTGGYMGGYPVAGNGDCVHPLYSQSSLHMLYTPTSINMTNSSGNCGVPATSALSGGSLSYYTPGHPQPPVMSLNMGPPYRAPSSPHTPTQPQPLCSVGAPFMYVNGGGGGGSYAPPYGQQQQQSTQYVPPALISNMGIYRSNMKIMSSVRSSPPPRPPRDGSGGPKPPYNSRSPSSASKERHYDGTDKMHRYAPMPMLGIHFMPGGPLQQCVSGPSPALRLPFLPSHPRGQHHDMALGRPPKPRKQSWMFNRSKITSTGPGTHQPVPLSSNMATFPTVLKEGLQETDRTVMMTSEESGMKTPQL